MSQTSNACVFQCAPPLPEVACVLALVSFGLCCFSWCHDLHLSFSGTWAAADFIQMRGAPLACLHHGGSGGHRGGGEGG